jgi:hypothetical protein
VRLLSPVEQAYLNGTREFTKSQQRYIRCRLRKKLRVMGEDIASCNNTVAAALQPGCNGPKNLLTADIVNEILGPAELRSRDLRLTSPQLLSALPSTGGGAYRPTAQQTAANVLAAVPKTAAIS